MDDIFSVITIICALLWLCGLVMRRRAAPDSRLGQVADAILDWRSFYVALAVITVFRISLYEMFWIPSASMQPTLREGEFIIVDKNAYGIRMPLLGQRVTGGREPKRGEIVVFLYPMDKGVFFVKRLVGLPGDKLVIEGNSVAINGEELVHKGPASERYVYHEDNQSGLIAGLVNILSFDPGEKIDSLVYWERMPGGWHPFLLASKDITPRYLLRNDACKLQKGGLRLECIVPNDSYFVMGDNRHRSNDSRFWGFVPRPNLTGPATRIAISFDSLGRFFIPIGLAAEPHEVDGVTPLAI